MISRKRILVVDDEPQITRVSRTVLTGAAMKSALPKIVMRVCGWPGNGGRSDAALLDINMPEMSGIEACRAIRRLSPRLPILMLTVRDSAEDRIEAFRRDLKAIPQGRFRSLMRHTDAD